MSLVFISKIHVLMSPLRVLSSSYKGFSYVSNDLEVEEGTLLFLGSRSGKMDRSLSSCDIAMYKGSLLAVTL